MSAVSCKGIQAKLKTSVEVIYGCNPFQGCSLARGKIKLKKKKKNGDGGKGFKLKSSGIIKYGYGSSQRMG